VKAVAARVYNMPARLGADPGKDRERPPGCAFVLSAAHPTPAAVHNGKATHTPKTPRFFVFSPASTGSIDTATDLI
jgi:hypothetical protein